ncbi:MAG: AAA family ATPase [Planctomycetota bacterium]
MLTRLQIAGFKNLVDVDVRFGPFTCVAGANGTGKSNLFDAVHFLSALADRPLLEAALSVRDEGTRSGDVRKLFRCVGDRVDEEMAFTAEMIVPSQGEDELGQMAEATTTLLRYHLVLRFRVGEEHIGPGALEILKEELTPIRKGDARRHLCFPHKAGTWRRSAVQGRGRAKSAPFISTEGSGADRVIKLHQDGGSRGKPLPRSGANLPRTVLSAVNAAEGPTAALARKEMQSWRLLQLEPSSLRGPDAFTAPAKLGPDGANLAATLYHLARTNGRRSPQPHALQAAVYAQIANRLAELLDDVRAVSVDRDDKRDLLTLFVTDSDGTSHPARALSDGTLRFLALAVLELDPEATGLICLEEPENGIHPERIAAMLQLLQDIATDPEEPVGSDNPLRQVIVNTHSPAVVGEVPDDCLLVADLIDKVRGDERFKAARFSALPGTWRDEAGAPKVPRGRLLAYLNPHLSPGGDEAPSREGRRRRRTRVVDRPDLQQYFPFMHDEP